MKDYSLRTFKVAEHSSIPHDTELWSGPVRYSQKGRIGIMLFDAVPTPERGENHNYVPDRKSLATLKIMMEELLKTINFQLEYSEPQ